MAWRRIGDKPLSEPMLTRFIDAYMRHLGEMSWQEWPEEKVLKTLKHVNILTPKKLYFIDSKKNQTIIMMWSTRNNFGMFTVQFMERYNIFMCTQAHFMLLICESSAMPKRKFILQWDIRACNNGGFAGLA